MHVPLQILLVGDSGVGKSSLLVRFTTGGFEELVPTIGTWDTCERGLEVDDHGLLRALFF